MTTARQHLDRQLSVEFYEKQNSSSVLTPIRFYVFGLSFLLTLDIQKDFFKGRQSVHMLHKYWAKFVQAICNQRQSFALIHHSCEEVAVYVHLRVLWPSIFLIFIVGMNWRTLQPTTFSTWWLKSRIVIRAIGLSRTWEPCIKRGNCHYRTSPIGYWGKGSTVGWYKVLGFLYL